MPTIPWIPTITRIADGDDVSPGVVNPVFTQLAQRDQYLYERFDEFENKSVLLAYSQPVHVADVALVRPGSAVYYKNDGVNEGLSLALAGFTSNGFSSFFSPNNACFLFGLVKSVATGTATTADVYLQGLVELSYDMDDPVYGVLEAGSTFAVGPYFLSRRESGKLTQAPAGVAVYVGYAKSKREFILNPSVEEFAQFFIHYRFNILDRPIGTPVLAAGLWSVTSPDVSPTKINRVGWLNVADIPVNVVPPANIPSGAKFFYGLPVDLLSPDPVVYNALDNPGVSTNEKFEAKETALAIPPYPNDLIYFVVNGSVQLPRSTENPNGIFTIDQFGVWWYNDAEGYQPWASDIGSGVWVPTDWPTVKGSENLRPRMILQFLKFNPDLRSALVTSVVPFNDATNNTANVVSLHDAVSGASASKGDLLLKYNLPVNSSTESPVTGTAIKTVDYDQINGQLAVTNAPVVTSITGVNGAVATRNETTGEVVISIQSAGLTGQVSDLEPENARLEFVGLHSYLNFVNSAVLPTGVVGKFVIPPGIASGNNLSLVLFLFGKTATASQQSVSFNFYYALSTPKSLATGNPEWNYVINSSITPGVNPVAINLPAAVYTPYESFYATPTGMVIPYTKIRGDMVVNFRMTRTTSTYTGDVGLLAVYWKLGS